MSIAALRLPVVTSSRSCGSRSSTARGNAVRSRMATTTSKGCSRRDQRVLVGQVVGELDHLDRLGQPATSRRRSAATDW